MSPWLPTRAAAYWLIALICFPFSAPLSVCDLADLVANTTGVSTSPMSKAPTRVSVVNDALAQSFPVRITGGRTRRDAADRSSSHAEIGRPTTLTNQRPVTTTSTLARPRTKRILRI